MSDVECKIALVWITKAQHDLNSAKILAESKPAILDIAIYHCQQAAEKAMKGFLVFHGQQNIKTHDIGLLVRTAMRWEASFSTWQDIADQLTPYATIYRYPGEIAEPSVEEFQDALEASESLLQFVQSQFL